MVYDGEDPYPSLSGYHDYEPQLEFDDAELLERKPEPEGEPGLEDVETAGHIARGREFLESPMSDGTIDEDFAEALAKEVDVAGKIGSPTTPMVNSKIFGGKTNHQIESVSQLLIFQRRLWRTIVTLQITVLWMSLATIKEEER